MQNCKEKSKADSVKHGAGCTQMCSGCDAEMAAEGPGEGVGFPTDPCPAQERRSLDIVLRVPASQQKGCILFWPMLPRRLLTLVHAAQLSQPENPIDSRL